MAEKQSAAEVVREELMKLVKDGDLKKAGMLTPAVLLRIMRVAKTGRDLLVCLDTKDSNLANMVRRPQFGSPFTIGDNLGDEEVEGPGLGMAAPYAPALPQENFGMTAMRELIAIAKTFNGPSPAKLVEALAIAKEKGLEDVAKDLENQLKVATAKPSSGEGDGVKPTVLPLPPTTPEALMA